MTVSVEIGDRLYDYSDEERAAEVIAEFQLAKGLDDDDILSLWNDWKHPLRADLEKRIFDAVDANGSAKRASEHVPGDVCLYIGNDE